MTNLTAYETFDSPEGDPEVIGSGALAAYVTMQHTHNSVAAFKGMFPELRIPWGSELRRMQADMQRIDSRAKAVARKVVATIPSLAAFEPLRAALIEFNETAPDEITTRLLIGLMMDCYQTVRRDTAETLAEVLVLYALAGHYPPQVVARACALLLPQLRYPPTVADFAKALKEAAWPGIALIEVERAIELRMQAEAVLAAANDTKGREAQPVEFKRKERRKVYAL